MNSTYELTISSDLFSNVTLYNQWPTYVYLSAYVLNFIVGLPINSYVLWLMCRRRGSGIAPQFFNLNLVVCETIFCLSSIFFFIISYFCDVIGVVLFILALPNAGRPLINCLICIERYLAVLHPVFFLKYKPLRYRMACSGVIWMMVLVFGACSMFALPNDFFRFICVYLPLYPLILSIKLFCFFAICKSLRDPGTCKKGKASEKSNPRKRKAIIIILLITATMFLQYTPLFIAGILYRSLSVDDFNALWCIAAVISFLLPYASPVVYIYYNFYNN